MQKVRGSNPCADIFVVGCWVVGWVFVVVRGFALEGRRFCLGLVAGWVLLCDGLVFGVGVGCNGLVVAACACLMSVLGVCVCLRVWWLVCAGGCGRVGWCAAGRKV